MKMPKMVNEYNARGKKVVKDIEVINSSMF